MDSYRKMVCSAACSLAIALLFVTGLGAGGTVAHAQTASACPLPAFPNASCTGWAHTGVTLTNHGGSCTLSTAGAIYDRVRFNCLVVVNANNVTIRRSEINGAIDDSGNHSGLLVEDTLIDCHNDTIQAIGHSQTQGTTSTGFTARRVHVKNCSWGFYAQRMTVEDSFCEQIYGIGDQHNECVLASGPGPHRFVHNTFFGEYNSSSSLTGGGGMSSAVSFYVHGDVWNDITQGVLFQHNYLRSEPRAGRQGGFCLYGGASPAGDGDNTTNGVFRDNVFARGASGLCGSFGPITAPASGPGSCWANNRYDDGTAINTSPVCSGAAPPPVKPSAPSGLQAR